MSFLISIHNDDFDFSNDIDVLIFYFPQHILVNVFLSYDNNGANA